MHNRSRDAEDPINQSLFEDQSDLQDSTNTDSNSKKTQKHNPSKKQKLAQTSVKEIQSPISNEYPEHLRNKVRNKLLSGLRPIRAFSLGKCKNQNEMAKGVLERKIKVRKVLLGNRTATTHYKIINVLHKLHQKYFEPLKIDKMLLKNIIDSIKISVTKEMVIGAVNYILNADIVFIKQNQLFVNQDKMQSAVFEKLIDDAFLELLSDKYDRTLKIIEEETVKEQEKFESEVKRKNIEISGNYFSIKSNINKADIDESDRNRTANVELRMANILERLKNKKNAIIKERSTSSLIPNIRYIFEIENKTRLALKYVLAKLKVQSQLGLLNSRKDVDELFQSDENKGEF